MNRFHRSWIFRATARTTIAGLVCTSFPIDVVAGQPAQGAPETSKAKQQKPEIPSAPAKLGNRRLPNVTPPPAVPQFSDPPTDLQFFKARIFEEPLVPEHPGSSAENKALGEAANAYIGAKTREDLSAFERFLGRHPQTVWKVSLLTNMAIVARRTGYFTRALDHARAAWDAGRNSDDLRVRALAERALAELLELSARLGRLEELERLFNEVEGRDFIGVAGERISQARDSLWLMQHRPEISYRCGPLAVGSILAAVKHAQDARIEATKSTPRGTSLLQMETLARTVGLDLRVAKRESATAPILVPSMVHWKAGHFGALVRAEGDRYLLQDPTFGDEMWVSGDAVRAEADGYFLVPTGLLPRGWRAVHPDEGSAVWGKGAPPGQDTEPQTPSAPTTGGNGDCTNPPPMAIYWFNEMLASLVVSDTPVGYSPPRGPDVRFRVTYNQREAFQPTIFTFANIGPMWTFDWLGYISDHPSNPNQTVTVYEQGGGRETYTGYNGATQSYAAHFDSRAMVKRVSTSPIRYERTLRDGTVEVYGQADGGVTFPRKVFLTTVRDPQGNERTHLYDSDFRLAGVVDAIGQVTTISYESSDPLKITRVTDPFGRFAQLEYDANGRLSRITDVIGLVSELTYAGTQVIALTTPYGTTRFVAGQTGADRSIEATDPLGGKERQAFVNGHSPEISAPSDPPSTVPTGFAPLNHHLDTAMGLFWDKKAMSMAPGESAAASITHWGWKPGTSQATAVPRARKRALESRVWYSYIGEVGQYIGTDSRPTLVARVLDEGVSQIYRYEYGPRGNKTKAIDPLGRETIFEYDTNDIDLLRVKQKNGFNYDLLQTYTYNTQHLPLTITDAAGQTTTHTYNAAGQILTKETPPRAGLTLAQRTTSYVYDANGFLQSITGPTGSSKDADLRRLWARSDRNRR